MWLKIKQEGLRRFWSMFPLTRVPFGYRFFEPQPYGEDVCRSNPISGFERLAPVVDARDRRLPQDRPCVNCKPRRGGSQFFPFGPPVLSTLFSGGFRVSLLK